MSTIEKMSAAAHSLLYPLALTTLTAAPVVANAATVTVESGALVANNTAQVTGGNFTNLDVYVDPLAFTLSDGQVKYVLCADLYHEQTIAELTNEVRTIGSLTTDFSLGNGAGAALTSTQIGILGGLENLLTIDMSQMTPDLLLASEIQAEAWLVDGATSVQPNGLTSDGLSSFTSGEAYALSFATANPDSNVITYNAYANGEQSFIGLAPVPEPASWALAVVGFGVVGGAMRLRQRPVATRGHRGLVTAEIA